VYDLFADERERASLPVREHATDGFFLEGCKLVSCNNYNVACMEITKALKNRHIGGHDLNSRSNRSHCITEIYIDLPGNQSHHDDSSTADWVNSINAPLNADYDPVSQQHEYSRVMGRMTLVDLAGSERLKSTNSTGKVLQEAGFINRSLYVLGKVIAGLVRTGGDLNHKDVPYRDSKLTKLLISSLSGRSRTMLIACVTEASGSQAETLRTLKFSMSCARIKNRPVKFLDPQEKLILDLREEVKRLRVENKQLRNNITTAPSSMSGSIDDDENSVGSVKIIRRTVSAQDNVKRSQGVKKKNKIGGKNSVSTSILQSVGINRDALNKLDLDLDEILDTNNDISSVHSNKSKSPKKGPTHSLTHSLTYLLTYSLTYSLR